MPDKSKKFLACRIDQKTHEELKTFLKSKGTSFEFVMINLVKKILRGEIPESIWRD